MSNVQYQDYAHDRLSHSFETNEYKTTKKYKHCDQRIPTLTVRVYRPRNKYKTDKQSEYTTTFLKCMQLGTCS